jgi:hypothetical protein
MHSTAANILKYINQSRNSTRLLVAVPQNVTVLLIALRLMAKPLRNRVAAALVAAAMEPVAAVAAAHIDRIDAHCINIGILLLLFLIDFIRY